MNRLNSQQESWDLVIAPQSRWLDLKLKQVWRYRDLLFLFVKRDFISFYKQTILGPIWFFIQPIFTTIIYVFVFGRLAGISSDGIPQPLFYLAGITAWTYFSDCLVKTSTVFSDNVHIFGKVYFPRLVMPLSIVISNLVRFGVQLTLLLLMMIFYAFQGYGFQFSSSTLLFPVMVVLMAFQGLGLGMIVSAMTTKYKDLALLLRFGIQLLMYLTTVVYPLSSLSGKMKLFVTINPMTPVIEGIRLSLFGEGSFNFISFIYVTLVTLIILLSGVLVYNRVEKNFVDTI